MTEDLANNLRIGLHRDDLRLAEEAFFKRGELPGVLNDETLRDAA